MKRFIIFCLLVSAIPGVAISQCNNSSTGYTCQDSVRSPDPYHIICESYEPVCGCDNKTYRNSDAAYWWGALNQWSDGPCELFDVDIYPNIITRSGSGVGHLRIYMKQPGTATVTIYNVFGKLMFERLFSTSLSNAIIPEADPYELYEAQVFPRGLYLAIVTVNGTQKARRLLKIEQ